MMLNATFNNVSDIPWQSVLLVEESGVPGYMLGCSPGYMLGCSPGYMLGCSSGYMLELF